MENAGVIASARKDMALKANLDSDPWHLGSGSITGPSFDRWSAARAKNEGRGGDGNPWVTSNGGEGSTEDRSQLLSKKRGYWAFGGFVASY